MDRFVHRRSRPGLRGRARRLLLAGGPLVLGGCFSSDPAGAMPECEEFAQSVTVRIEDYRFDPALACVARGGRVTWVNVGAEGHSSTTDSAVEGWDSGILSSGEDFTREFERSGEFPYICTPHPFMAGAVRVE